MRVDWISKYDYGSDTSNTLEFCKDRVFVNSQGILYPIQVAEKPKRPVTYHWTRRPNESTK